MKRVLLGLSLLLGIACNAGTVPAPFAAQLLDLRNQNDAIERQEQDLNAQIQKLQVEKNYNCERMNAISAEALRAKGLEFGKFYVDINTLQIKEKK